MLGSSQLASRFKQELQNAASVRSYDVSIGTGLQLLLKPYFSSPNRVGQDLSLLADTFNEGTSWLTKTISTTKANLA